MYKIKSVVFWCPSFVSASFKEVMVCFVSFLNKHTAKLQESLPEWMAIFMSSLEVEWRPISRSLQHVIMSRARLAISHACWTWRLSVLSETYKQLTTKWQKQFHFPISLTLKAKTFFFLFHIIILLWNVNIYCRAYRSKTKLNCWTYMI